MIMGQPANYDLMADFMLSATLALNDMIRMGVSQDWATHMIGHELTALHGITHGESLAMVLPGTLRTLKDQKYSKLLQYSERVFGITQGSPDERIEMAIAKTEEFFRSLGDCQPVYRKQALALKPWILLPKDLIKPEVPGVKIITLREMLQGKS